MASQTPSADPATSFLEDDSFEELLRRAVALPTVARTASGERAVARYAQEILIPLLERAGFDAPTHRDGIALVAHRPGTGSADHLVLYGHADVVPAESAGWTSDPWTLSTTDEAWTGRGTADSKGQHLLALLSLIRRREAGLPVRAAVTLIIDFEEEIGSPRLGTLLRTVPLPTRPTAFLGLDGSRTHDDRPTVLRGNRGVLTVELRSSFDRPELHSGTFGGLVENPALRIASAIAALQRPDGSIDVPEWRSEENAVEVLQIDAAAGRPARSAIPAAATATVQLRFVETTAATDADTVRRHLRERGIEGVEVRHIASAGAWKTPTDAPWVRVVHAALADDFAVVDDVPRLRGTVPTKAVCEIWDLPAVWLPLAQPASGQHAPDEHLSRRAAADGALVLDRVFAAIGL